VHRTFTRLNGITHDACAVYARRAKAAGVILAVDAPKESVHLDGVRVRQAVENLIANALRSTPPGGRIHVVAVRDREWVRVAVEDTGPGFAPGFIDRAFEPFTRGVPEGGRGPEGAGLGLAIVRAVAEAHGGSAEAENRPEGGARVTFVLRVGEEQPLRAAHDSLTVDRPGLSQATERR
jgi:signal transduction histidine kinase